jgi:hypothetical protein
LKCSSGTSSSSGVERLELPPDLANGLIITLLKNVRRGAVGGPLWRTDLVSPVWARSR